MLQRGLFSDKTPYRKFLILVGLTLIGSVIFSMLGAALAGPIFGVNFTNNPNPFGDLSNPATVNAALFIQLAAAIGTFVLPALIGAYLFSTNSMAYLCLNIKPTSKQILLALSLLIIAVPFINWMTTVNGQMHLPASMKAMEDQMKAMEDSAAKLTDAFLNSTAIPRLLANFLVIAILPAIGEELLFRGMIQRLFKGLTGNIHVSIVLTAILFSALHMQFYGFLPRFALGALFGYFLYWSGSLWLPICAHLLNNGLAIVFAYLATGKNLSFNQDTIGTQPGEEWILGLSVFLSWALVYMLSKTKVKS